MLEKGNARLGQKVRYGLGIGTVDAITQSVVAIRMEDGRYVLARWGEGVYVA